MTEHEQTLQKKQEKREEVARRKEKEEEAAKWRRKRRIDEEGPSLNRFCCNNETCMRGKGKRLEGAWEEM
jgi:hypothetical protein